MDQAVFWALIEAAKKEADPAKWLVGALRPMDETEIIDFECHFRTFMDTCHTQNLWAAAHLILGGCPSERFEHFKAWIVSLGQSAYVSATRNPDTLAHYLPQGDLHASNMPQREEFSHIGVDAYYLRVSGSIGYNEAVEQVFTQAVSACCQSPEPAQQATQWLNEDELRRLFPALWSRFSDEPLNITDSPLSDSPVTRCGLS